MVVTVAALGSIRASLESWLPSTITPYSLPVCGWNFIAPMVLNGSPAGMKVNRVVGVKTPVV
jgi:hypothetical protein